MGASNNQGKTFLPSAAPASEVGGEATAPLKLQFEVTLPPELGRELNACRKAFERVAEVMERWLENALAHPGFPPPPAMPWTAALSRQTQQPAPSPSARVETLPPPPPAPPPIAPRPILPDDMAPILVEEPRPIRAVATVQDAKAKKSAPRQLAEVRSPSTALENTEAATAEHSAAAEQAAFDAQRGESYRAAGNKEKALVCYRTALDLDADCTRAYLGRASIYIEQGRFSEALLDCNAALKREPERAVLYVLRGLVYVRQGNLKGALDEAEEAIRHDPQLPSAYVLRGSTWFKKGKLSEALADVKTAIRLRPTNAKFHAELARMLAQTGQHEQAAHTYAKVLELSPNFHEARLQRGVELRQAGDAAAAEAELTEHLRRCPATAASHYQRGLCRLARRNYAQAITDFDKAIALKPEDLAAYEAKDKTLQQWEGTARQSRAGGMGGTAATVALAATATDAPASVPTRPIPLPPKPTTAKTTPAKTKAKPAPRRSAARSRYSRDDDDDEERPSWIRRAAVAAAVVGLLYLLGPMAWSFVTSRWAYQDDKDDTVAEVRISAAELWKRFQNEPASAQTEFDQRVIEVSGVVKDFRPREKEGVQIVLVGDKQGGLVVCAMPPAKGKTQGTLLSRIDRLGKVVLKGKCTGKEGQNVNIDGVRLIAVQSR